ncbi:MAG: hypothetical protein LBN18_07680 [Dysgonamonadaceae bacterium]|nr:hypothetical protein [Dysgonamonadaceae bacterium]
MKKYGAIAVILFCNTMVLTAAPFPNGRNVSRGNNYEQNRFTTSESFNASKLQDPFVYQGETDDSTPGQLRMGGDPADPGKTPVGNSLWLLAAMGLTYGVYLFGRKRKAEIIR